jgi:hypothetical protein
LWTIFSVFWAANIVLLVALFSKGDVPERFVGIILSAVGLILCFVWHQVQARALYHALDSERLMDNLEGELRLPPQLSAGHRLVTGARQNTPRLWPRARTLMPWCSFVACASWVVGIVAFLGTK